MTAAKTFEGVVLDMRPSFGFTWCSELGVVFVASSKNVHLPSRNLTSVFRPGNWVRFRAIRQLTLNACSWLAVNLALLDNPPSLKSQNGCPAHLGCLEGYGVAFPNIDNEQTGFIWNEQLGCIRFARSAVAIQPSSIPPPFTVVRFVAKFVSSSDMLKYFEATEVGPSSSEEVCLVAGSCSIMKFDQCRLLRLPSSEAPGVFHCGKAEEELLCVPGADLFSSVRQLDPECSYLIHAVPNVWDPADVSVDEYVAESHRKKKWRVLVVRKEEKVEEEPKEPSAPASSLAIFSIVLKDNDIFDKMEARHPGFMGELMRQKELKRQSDLEKRMVLAVKKEAEAVVDETTLEMELQNCI